MVKKMTYKDYEVKQLKHGIEISEVHDFDMEQIFECGQCFRWSKGKDNSYIGIVKGKAVRIKYNSGVLSIFNANKQDFKDIWFEYFDLGTDYSLIKKILSKDSIMKQAISFGSGLRILKQDFNEVLVSYILSSNKRIPQITSSIEKLCKLYGKEINFEGEKIYTFPELNDLANSTADKLNYCRGGYRCGYILKSTRSLAMGGIDPASLYELETAKARETLMQLPGIGQKVADCILLYSGIKLDVFPVDVWIKRVIEELFLGKEVSLKEIQNFAHQKFGNLLGYAQLYLFYYARLNKIGIAS